MFSMSPWDSPDRLICSQMREQEYLWNTEQIALKLLAEYAMAEIRRAAEAADRVDVVLSFMSSLYPNPSVESRL
jgi:hypothetical protein